MNIQKGVKEKLKKVPLLKSTYAGSYQGSVAFKLDAFISEM